MSRTLQIRAEITQKNKLPSLRLSCTSCLRGFHLTFHRQVKECEGRGEVGSEESIPRKKLLEKPYFIIQQR